MTSTRQHSQNKKTKNKSPCSSTCTRTITQTYLQRFALFLPIKVASVQCTKQQHWFYGHIYIAPPSQKIMLSTPGSKCSQPSSHTFRTGVKQLKQTWNHTRGTNAPCWQNNELRTESVTEQRARFSFDDCPVTTLRCYSAPHCSNTRLTATLHCTLQRCHPSANERTLTTNTRKFHNTFSQTTPVFHCGRMRLLATAIFLQTILVLKLSYPLIRGHVSAKRDYPIPPVFANRQKYFLLGGEWNKAVTSFRGKLSKLCVH